MGAKGIDVEALSPRDINAQRPRATNDLKTKAAAQLKATKDKEHPPPPPPNVTEPPSSDRRDGAVYQVGRLLGKGGFAICYEGQLAGTRKRYALKIVKSKMPAKMEQKVGHMLLDYICCILLTGSSSFKPNCKFTPRCDNGTSSNFCELSLSRTRHTSSWRSARTGRSWTW